ncbi:MAG: MoxR family ATPase [Armatimonadia bacterium]
MDVAAFARKVIENVEQVVVGKRDQIRLALVALLCEGHVLMEDVPGVAKTMLARALARSLGCSFARVQCTPDLLPSDVTGVSVFNQKLTEFEFRAGPVFHQILLADEINRATPRAQSALLEAMGERQVSADGETYPLPRPFMVLATQNPIEHEGTFPLPEAQLDRFLIRMSIGYPSFSDENVMLERLRLAHPIDQLRQVVTVEELTVAQAEVRNVFLHDKVREYVVRLVHATRHSPDLVMGASPRASMALYRTAQALAAVEGRNFATPDDVKYMVQAVLCHRVIVAPESRLRGQGAEHIVEALIETVPAPIEKTRQG